MHHALGYARDVGSHETRHSLTRPGPNSLLTESLWATEYHFQRPQTQGAECSRRGDGREHLEGVPSEGWTTLQRAERVWPVIKSCFKAAWTDLLRSDRGATTLCAKARDHGTDSFQIPFKPTRYIAHCFASFLDLRIRSSKDLRRRARITLARRRKRRVLACLGQFARLMWLSACASNSVVASCQDVKPCHSRF